MVVFFYILSFMALLSALGVLILRNPIYSALALISNLLCVAGFFALMDAHFLATVQIIVYAGAIMVLVVFVLMLLNVKTEPVSGKEVAYTVVGSLVGATFFLTIIANLRSQYLQSDQVPPVGGVKEIGALLYTRYLFPFEAASILIMAAIVGAVLLAKRKYGGSS
ncbi:MAG: NADH-quinone oxidoreductase subunit J [Bdellovibrionales bacterium]|nr:NADH-quinone oxidoreductase subunit J [Bdellovibrionales bacterium]